MVVRSIPGKCGHAVWEFKCNYKAYKFLNSNFEKKTFLSLIIISMVMTFTACRKSKTLPPETRIGANTFGCLVNGQIFKPKGNSGIGPVYQCYYQQIYPGESGFVFHVSGTNRSSTTNGNSEIDINCDSIKIQSNKIYVLKGASKGNSVGAYATVSMGVINEHVTNNTYNGELQIKVFDETNNIVSGTFWFNAINSAGESIKVTDGRFDMKFTR